MKKTYAELEEIQHLDLGVGCHLTINGRSYEWLFDCNTQKGAWVDVWPNGDSWDRLSADEAAEVGLPDMLK